MIRSHSRASSWGDNVAVSTADAGATGSGALEDERRSDTRSAPAWMVRGGRDGEREGAALSEGLVIVGWDELGDIASCQTRDELRQALRQAYPGEGKATIANWTGQLWRFRHDIKVGDLVVMPLKTYPQKIAIGRFTGDYRFRHDAPPGFRHVRPVHWIRQDLPRTAVEQDLLDTLGSLLTVCRLQRHEAARRLARLADTGTDPGPSHDESPRYGVKNREDLFDKAMQPSAPDEPLRLTIRELLSHWDAVRRTPAVVSQIERDLQEKGLTTRPPFTEGWIDTVVDIVAVGEEPGDGARTTEPALAYHTEDVSEFPAITLRLGVLASANSGVASVRPDDDLIVAETMMIDGNYSQLAVIDETGKLHGAISWESMGQARISRTVTTIADALVSARSVDHNEDLLGQIEEIYRSGYVFVIGNDRKVTGIVTAADLSLQFGDQVRPFALVEEAERRLRRRVDEVFDEDELRALVRSPRPVTSAADMTIGNYKHLLADVERWRRLGWAIDHRLFLSRLEEIRRIRNELMHFTPDPVTQEQLNRVEGFVRLLRTVDPRD
ncbi:CBS domain-containing protein [Amycolatopsis thermoflava]|nr:CBS domain-containing protein [Amycolatopsis thermoflava]